ncbi:MAG: hypothetical protein HN772_06845, partial [Euryarchaeota archaeon]|nr:hypothetical protein [Euryarchaeota archaeon]
TFTMGSSALAAALILENELLELREVIAITGAIQIAIGLLWVIFASPSEKKLFP